MSRGSFKRWLSQQPDAPPDAAEWLTDHPVFNAYGHILLCTCIPKSELLKKDLHQVVNMAAQQLRAMESVRRAMSSAA